MTASTEAGVEEFNNELAGRHHVKPDQPAASTPSANGSAAVPNTSAMHSNDTGVPSAHTVVEPAAKTETEAEKA